METNEITPSLVNIGKGHAVGTIQYIPLGTSCTCSLFGGSEGGGGHMCITRAGDRKALILPFDGTRGVKASIISNDRAVVSDGRTSAWKHSLLGMPAAYLISTYCSASVSHTHVHICLTLFLGWQEM